MKTEAFLPILVACVISASSMASMAAPPSAADTLSDAERVKTVGPNMNGAHVLRAQVLLERAHFSAGEIDAAYGSNLRNAIDGFQKAKGLKPTGRVDSPTWDALNTDTAPVLTAYTILDSDVAGPFEPLPPAWADKAKMTTLGYVSADEALSEKFHVSPKLLKQLNPGKDFGRAGEEIITPNIPAEELPRAAKVVVDGSHGTLSLLDANGKSFAQFPATTGSKHDPLPLGNWKINGVAHHPKFDYDPKLFWDSKPDDVKTTVPPGPNNPVGVVWIDLSKAHYGIHGTPEPSTIGKTQSHGCIRLTNWDATTVAHSVAPGADVLLQK